MKILFVEPYARTLFSFRKELLDELIFQGHEVILCTENTKGVSSYFSNRVKEIINVSLNLKSKNIFKNYRLLKTYKAIIKKTKPDLILSYTIKPNIYCGFYAKKIPMVANVTGLGSIFNKKGFLSKLGIFLYKKTFKNVDYVFFQNEDCYRFFNEHKIPVNHYRIIPGSGVNLDKFVFSNVSQNSADINFLFASRAIKEKGFDLLIESIPYVLEDNPNVHFNFLSAEEDVNASNRAKAVFSKYSKNISVLERTDNMSSVYAKNDFLVSPSFYREGISNVLLESLACGRPIITTCDNPGCMEVLVEGQNGLGVKSNDLDSLKKTLIRASHLSKKEINRMGEFGRQFVTDKFSRATVIRNYLEIIEKYKTKNQNH